MPEDMGHCLQVHLPLVILLGPGPVGLRFPVERRQQVLRPVGVTVAVRELDPATPPACIPVPPPDAERRIPNIKRRLVQAAGELRWDLVEDSGPDALGALV